MQNRGFFARRYFEVAIVVGFVFAGCSGGGGSGEGKAESGSADNSGVHHTTGIPHSHGDGHGGLKPGGVYDTSHGAVPPTAAAEEHHEHEHHEDDHHDEDHDHDHHDDHHGDDDHHGAPPPTASPSDGRCSGRLAHTTGVPHQHGDGHGGCKPGEVYSYPGTDKPPPAADGALPPPDSFPTHGQCAGRTSHTTGVPHQHGDGHGGCRPGEVYSTPGSVVQPPEGGDKVAPPTDEDDEKGKPAPSDFHTGGQCPRTSHTTGVPHSHGDGHGGCRPGAVYEREDGLSKNKAARETTAQCLTPEPNLFEIENLHQRFSKYRSGGLGLKARQVEIEIPIVFHIIDAGEPSHDLLLSDALILEQVAVLNDAFQGKYGGERTPFRFRPASINRVRNPNWSRLAPGAPEELQMKEQLRRGGAETLNVYVVDLGPGVLGYASPPYLSPRLPHFDGVVLNAGTLLNGAIAEYNLGHALVHQAGHWLGLLHTSRGGCEDPFGDLVDDTPAEHEGDEFHCSVGRNTCDRKLEFAAAFNHMTRNIDGCRLEFTAGQVEFMVFNAVEYRLSAIAQTR